jgi:hypothetical protein
MAPRPQRRHRQPRSSPLPRPILPRLLRLERGISLERVAAASGLSTYRLSLHERGLLRPALKRDELARWVAALTECAATDAMQSEVEPKGRSL